MVKLTSKIHDLIKSNPNVYGKEDNYTPMYESGINLLDYRNGFLNTVTDDERIGLMGGKVTTFIGGSGSGKTTLAIQAAAKIVEPFENASIIHYDFEDATTDERIYQLTGWSKQTKQDKYTKLNKKISLDSVDQLIRGIRDTKLESEEEFTIHTDKIDPETGEKVSFMAPTVVIIDSVATMASKEIDDKDGEGGQMNATKQAKDNTTFIKRIIGSSTLNSANIDINPYAATPKELNYLKQGEALPGGKAINYMANNMFKISPSQALDPEGSSNQAKYGIKGFINTVEVIKSRSNAAGAKFNLIFEQKDGFNNTLSNLLYLQEQKLLKGNPRAYRIDGYDDVSFTLKTFQEKYEGNKDFQEYFDKYIRNIYKDKFLASIEHESSLDEEELELVECINQEEDIWLGSDGKYYDSEKNEVEVEKS